MGKQSKQTRKFAPKLKKVIQRRREYQKNRDKYKKTGGEGEDDRKIQKQQKVQEEHDGDNAKDIKNKNKKKAPEDDELAGLNADEFLEEGFFNEMGDDEESVGEEAEEEEVEGDDEDEIESHKKQLEELRETQPEFYEFLQKEGGELLDFGDSDEDMDEEGDEEEGEGVARGFVITKETFDKWVQIAIKLKSPKALKKVVAAFKAACHMNDETDDETVMMKKQYKILDSGVFNHLIVGSLKNMSEILDNLINRDKSTETDTKKFYPAKYPRWRKLNGIVKIYLSNLLHFMNQLSDPKMLAFILKQMENQLPYFGPFAKLSKNLLKKMLDLWGSATETVRILAFINIRRMALDFPYPFIGSCLKGVYLTYVRNAKFTNPKTLPLINFMSNCVTEIYGLDWNLSYQHMFVYVRQLAIILRTSFNTKSKDSYDTVYNWQFINSIRAFVRIFSAYPNQPVLQLLIHPLMQIIQGVISLVPTPRYFPLRFQCVRMMNEVAMFNTGTYINGLPFLLEVLNSPEVSKKAKPTMQKQTDLVSQLKIANKMLGTKVYQDMVLKDCIDLIEDYLSIYAYSISFPELAVPATINLKRFLKQCKIPFFRKRVSTILEEVHSNSKYIQAKRVKLNMNPSDVDKAKLFMKEECENQMGLTPLMKHRIKVQRILSGKVELNQKHIDEYNANYKKNSAESDSEDEEVEGGDEGDDDEGDDDVLDGVADSEDEEEQVKPAAKPGQKQQKKIQTPSNGEDLVEDMDLADFENSDDEEMAGDE